MFNRMSATADHVYEYMNSATDIYDVYNCIYIAVLL
jgi:hypothetical protein